MAMNFPPNPAPETLEQPVAQTTLDGYLFVAAIDFGTTYSGYAFSFINDKFKKISMNKNWSGGSFESYKAPTSVLFGPSGFREFGYEAEIGYCSNIVEKLDLFRHFKMMLYDKTITKSFEIAATNGTKRPAVEVFSEALKFLKDHMIEAINKSVGSTVDEQMIRWVITLPAIWQDNAKQFMREAALKAKLIETLHSCQLILVLEPEVASIYCREVPVNITMSGSAEGTAHGLQLDPGCEYVIIDAGGGTVDITAHKILKGGFVREILQPSGGPWGGTQVDRKFEELLKKVFGAQIVSDLQQNSEMWLKLMMSFEVAKKGIDSRKPTTGISLDMNYQLCKRYAELSEMNIEQSLSRDKNQHVYFANGRLIISHETSLGLFKPTVQTIAEYVQKLLLQPDLANISFVLLVGGFGTCEILQSNLQCSLPAHIKLIIPQDAQLAIVKGAVQFGLNTKYIESRFARKTYGIDTEPKFQEKLHDPRKRIVKDGIEYCDDVFLKFIDKGTPVTTDEVTCRTLRARTTNQSSMSFDIFCCEETDPNTVEYVTAHKFTRVGGLTVLMPNKKGGRHRGRGTV